MSIYHVLVINRAGSLIFDWENRPDTVQKIEKTYGYPLGIVLELRDQKPTVVFGERDGIRLNYIVTSVNGRALKGHFFVPEEADQETDFMEYVQVEDHFPMTIAFSPPVLSANEKIILSSMFHSLYTIAAQLSPVSRSSGIQVLETSQFSQKVQSGLEGQAKASTDWLKLKSVLRDKTETLE
ncbi:Protein F36D4.2, partial [Aphelenchoides avenae]